LFDSSWGRQATAPQLLPRACADRPSEPGRVSETFAALKANPVTANIRNKVKFILAIDGEMVEAEVLTSDEPSLAWNTPHFDGIIKMRIT